MFLNTRNNVLIGAAVLLMAGIGAAAWIHSAESHPSPSPAPSPVAALVPAPPVGPGDNSQSGAVNYATAAPVSQSADGYYPSIPPPAYISQPQPPPPEPVANQYADAQYGYAGSGRVIYRRHREHHHGRSKKHSIEIVAGTAAAGAAIGAIAEGGPGAAIGAISGAGAGFTYDRLTHTH